MNLRPTTLNDVIGQSKIKQRLRISINAAKQQQQSLPHLLFDGPPGLGKTTLARVVAHELGSSIQIANGSNLRSIKNVLPYLARLTANSVLFIDEIHRLTTLVCEFLYCVMEDFRMDLVTEGEAVSIDLPNFCLIGATTEAGSLPPPLVDRFAYKFHLGLYSNDELSELLLKNSRKIQVDLSKECAKILAGASKDTPRVANSLLKWIKDYTLGKNQQTSPSLIKDALTLADIDPSGLDKNDKTYLRTLTEMDGLNKPVGLLTLAAATSLNKDTITEQIEPFLLRRKLIKKTSKGRMLCPVT